MKIRLTAFDLALEQIVKYYDADRAYYFTKTKDDILWVFIQRGIYENIRKYMSKLWFNNNT